MSEPNVKGAIAEIVRVIYLDDSSDYISGLWDALRELDEDAAILLEEDEEAAFNKYAAEEGEK